MGRPKKYFKMPDQLKQVVIGLEEQKDKIREELKIPLKERGVDGRKLNGKINELTTRQETIVKSSFDHPMKYFCPNLPQETIINQTVGCASESIISTTLYTCANGVGKTVVSVNIVGNLVWGVQNGWFDFELFKNFPFPKRIWYVTTPTNINDNLCGEESESGFYHWWKDKKWEPKKAGKNHYSKIEFEDNEWELSLKTYNQAVKEFESVTVGVIILDEPCPQHIWKALQSRTRQGCIIIMPMTPLDCDPYILEDVIKPAKEQEPGFRHIEATAWEAVEGISARGHFNEEALRAQIKRYNPDEVEARVNGKLMHFSQRIIQGAKEELHFVDPEDYPLKPNYLYFHIFDPADGRPNAEIWGAITPEGRYIVFYERPEDQTMPFWEMKGGEVVDDHIMEVIHLEYKLGKHHSIPLVPTRIVDYHFANQTRGTRKTTLIEDYDETSKKLGVDFELWESYKSPNEETELQYGHNRIRQLLRSLPDGKPGLVIWNTCFHAWNGLTHYVRKRPKTEADMMKRAGSGKIIEKYKDLVDVIRYFVGHDLSSVFKKNINISQGYQKPEEKKPYYYSDVYNQNPGGHIY